MFSVETFVILNYLEDLVIKWYGLCINSVMILILSIFLHSILINISSVFYTFLKNKNVNIFIYSFTEV